MLGVPEPAHMRPQPTTQQVMATRAALAQRQQQNMPGGPRRPPQQAQQTPVPGAGGYQFNPRTVAAMQQARAAAQAQDPRLIRQAMASGNANGVTLSPRAMQAVPQGRKPAPTPAQQIAATALTQGQMKRRAGAGSPQRGMAPPTRQAPAQVTQRTASPKRRIHTAGAFTDQLGISSLVGDTRPKNKRTQPKVKRRK